jgi:hypothetical protein
VVDLHLPVVTGEGSGDAGCLVEAAAVVQLLPSEEWIKIVRDGDPKIARSVFNAYRLFLL